jgi:hypothetical protein
MKKNEIKTQTGIKKDADFLRKGHLLYYYSPIACPEFHLAGSGSKGACSLSLFLIY